MAVRVAVAYDSIMCEWGNKVDLTVTVPADLSWNGEEHWATKPVDACLAPLVEAINEIAERFGVPGLRTSNCCCGHGKGPGWIALHNGAEIIVPQRSHS